MVRFGKVSQINKEKQTVQVLFEDLDGTTSNDLPIIYPHTLKNRVVKLPEINEEVVCIFSEGESDGCCIGSYANDSMRPSTIERFEFEDGTVLQYDTVAHHLLADIKGTATLKSEHIILQGNVTLEGDMVINGSTTMNGSVSCPDKCTCTS